MFMPMSLTTILMVVVMTMMRMTIDPCNYNNGYDLDHSLPGWSEGRLGTNTGRWRAPTSFGKPAHHRYMEPFRYLGESLKSTCRWRVQVEVGAYP